MPTGGDPLSALAGGGITGGDAGPSSAASDLFSHVENRVEFGPVTVGSATGGVISSAAAVIGLVLVVLLWISKK